MLALQLPAVVCDQLDRSGDTAECLRHLGRIDVDVRVSADNNGAGDVYVRDFAAETWELVATSTTGGAGTVRAVGPAGVNRR